MYKSTKKRITEKYKLNLPKQTCTILYNCLSFRK